MTRGRKPTPLHLKAITGGAGAGAAGEAPEDGGKRSVNLEAAAPFCPEPVSQNKDALQVWERLADLMVDAGLLTPIFEGTLACYCITYGRLVEAERKLRAAGAGNVTGWLIKSPNGYAALRGQILSGDVLLCSGTGLFLEDDPGGLGQRLVARGDVFVVPRTRPLDGGRERRGDRGAYRAAQLLPHKL